MSRAPNRLVHSSSPYLRQHANNPVDWYPWGEEAINLAKKLNKPIFLSVGYSTCYWCHVMERDVFENESIAMLMNEWFVNIKVDREERPDIDEIYMKARQLITREAGWPNNMFLTPDLDPFFGGGTFASDNRYGTVPFTEILQWIDNSWKNDNAKVLESASQVTMAVRTLMEHYDPPVERIEDPMKPAEKLFHYLCEHYDDREGGFYQAPKFPHEGYYQFLFEYHRKTGNKEALEMASLSLKKIAAGGIHDQIGGGFHRYAVDRYWRVPHFEKMLYNQALMVDAYTDSYELTGKAYHKDIAADLIRFVLHRMRDEGGAFYSALDAETDGIEGAYYAWEESELQALLSEEEFVLFQKCYALAEVPTFPGHHALKGKVIHARDHLIQLANDKNIPYEELHAKLKPIHAKLLAARDKRKLPHLDKKIIASWNGLMIEALAKAGKVFGEKSYIEAAAKAASFILEKMHLPDGRLSRIWGYGEALEHAYLEDYSFLIAGLLSLHQATGEKRWLEQAIALEDTAEKMFHDDAHGGYFYTDGDEHLIARIKTAHDSAIPSCTGVMLQNLDILYALTKDASYKAIADKLALTYWNSMNDHPADYVAMIQGMIRRS